MLYIVSSLRMLLSAIHCYNRDDLPALAGGKLYYAKATLPSRWTCPVYAARQAGREVVKDELFITVTYSIDAGKCKTFWKLFVNAAVDHC
jgi:hypothetical protein